MHSPAARGFRTARLQISQSVTCLCAEGLGEAAAPRDNPDTWRRAEFPVGRYCCARLALYHALFHWRHRLLARLKRELKAELRRRKVSASVG